MEPKTTKCFPRTLKYIISPKIIVVNYLVFARKRPISLEMFTISVTPFLVNKPRIMNGKVKEVSDQWIAFGPWW